MIFLWNFYNKERNLYKRVLLTLKQKLDFKLHICEYVRVCVCVLRGREK